MEVEDEFNKWATRSLLKAEIKRTLVKGGQ